CDLVEGAIDDAFGDRLLPVQHEVVHEFAENDITELRVRQDLSLFSAMTARHLGLAPHLGRLAPYFDRRWRRAAIPWVSSAPRMMWYRTPGRSFTRPPRIKTTECSCRL